MAVRRQKKKRTREDPFIIPGHGQFVRGNICCVQNGDCNGGIEAHHVRKGIPKEDRGGIGKKPHDRWLVALCGYHHAEFHQTGHDTFQKKYGVILLHEAEITFARSGAAIRWRWAQEELEKAG